MVLSFRITLSIVTPAADVASLIVSISILAPSINTAPPSFKSTPSIVTPDAAVNSFIVFVFT